MDEDELIEKAAEDRKKKAEEKAHPMAESVLIWTVTIGFVWLFLLGMYALTQWVVGSL